MDRLLIETDSSYFSLGIHKRSTPGIIEMAAEKVAFLGVSSSVYNHTERLCVRKLPPSCAETPAK
jgi:Tat protein secretion system quality control protein TatD with DNase activity